jgi:hypothetical protein
LGVVVVIILAEIPTVCGTFQRQRRLCEFGLLLPLTIAVWLIAKGAAIVAVDPHGAVTVVTVVRAAWSIDRNLVMINAKPIALSVTVGEKPPLQHLVGGKADARYHIGRVKGRLLYLGKIVFGVFVKFHHTYFDEQIILFQPYFGEIERMEVIFCGVFFRHDLDKESPAREIIIFDTVLEVTLVAFTAFADGSFQPLHR